MGLTSKVEIETLRRNCQQLLGIEFSEAWLERFRLQLEGLLEETSRLDELDLVDIEPARIFTNREG